MKVKKAELFYPELLFITIFFSGPFLYTFHKIFLIGLADPVFAVIRDFTGNIFIPLIFFSIPLFFCRACKFKSAILICSLISPILGVLGFFLKGQPGFRVLPQYISPSGASLISLAALLFCFQDSSGQTFFSKGLKHLFVMVHVLMIFFCLSRLGLFFLLLLVFVYIMQQLCLNRPVLFNIKKSNKKFSFFILVLFRIFIFTVTAVICFYFYSNLRGIKFVTPLIRSHYFVPPIIRAHVKSGISDRPFFKIVDQIEKSYIKTGKTIFKNEFPLDKPVSFKGDTDPVYITYKFARAVKISAIFIYPHQGRGKTSVSVIINNYYKYIYTDTVNAADRAVQKTMDILVLDFPPAIAKEVTIKFSGTYNSNEFSMARLPQAVIQDSDSGFLRPEYSMYGLLFNRFRELAAALFISSINDFLPWGLGPNKSRAFYKKSAFLFTSEGLLPPEHSHNFIMEWVIESGWPGFLSAAIFLVALIKRVISFSKYPYLWFNIVGIMIFLGFHFFDYITANPLSAAFSWAFLGILIRDSADSACPDHNRQEVIL
jgi:hypothetical protein